MRLGYLLRRAGLLVVVVWTAATINFVMPKLTPINPIRQRLYQMATQGGYIEAGIEDMIKSYEQRFGLDQPLYIQYFRYLGDMARLDLGYSLTAFPKRVADQIKEVVAWSVAIALTTLIISVTVGALLGALIAWPRAPKFLQYLVAPLMTISAVPAYIFGLVLIYFLAFRLKLFPMMGGVTLGVVHANSWEFFVDVFKHAILPTITVVLVSMGGWALGMRGMMVTVQGEDYMLLAEAKGLNPRRVFLRYAVRNALLPLVTGVGIALGNLVTGQILTESLFGFPGVGTLLSSSIRNFDYNTIYGITFMVILSIGMTTFILDIIYPLIDPRIRMGGR